jgi:hypothetical protein
MLVTTFGEQLVERQRIGPAREQLVAIDQVEESHRLAAERVDDVAVIDDVTSLVMVGRAAATQGEQPCGAEEAFQPVVV